MTREEIPTPALVIDVAAMDRNIERMAVFFAGRRCRLRPHFKAHKTPEIARRQLAAGGCVGLTCATVAEAEVARPICEDLLVANEVVGRDACRRIARLAGQLTLTVAVDSEAGIARLSEAARAAGVRVGILIDVNVGQNRCGTAPGADAVALARVAHATVGVDLRGVMGYEGHLVAIRERPERDARTREAMGRLLETAAAIRADGLPCDIVSVGGTGTFDIDADIAGITEIQAGSYVLMDTDYGQLDVPFEQALRVLGTVVSRPTPTRAVANCGHKAMTFDHGLPTVCDVAGATVTALNDEHAVMAVPESCTLEVGDLVELCPSHIDPTVNLHDVLYALEGDTVSGVWPVAARGYGAGDARATGPQNTR